MSERQAETPINHDTKPKVGPEQSWMYSSLIQAARPVASLAAKVGILPHLYSIYDRDFVNPQYNEEENKKLRDVWRKAHDESENENENTKVGFISLHIINRKDDESKIGQIGMSKWRSDGWTGMVSVHCQVEQETAVSESPFLRLVPGDFIYGDTEAITESDVGPWLDATFRSFKTYQDITCLIGHDIHRILHQIQPCWKVPSGVVILDTRAIWEFQSEVKQHPPFERTLEWVMDYRLNKSSINNAGNGARFILDLIQAQGIGSEQNHACA